MGKGEREKRRRLAIAGELGWAHGLSVSLHLHGRCSVYRDRVQRSVLGLAVALGAAVQQDVGLRAVNGVMNLQENTQYLSYFEGGGQTAKWAAGAKKVKEPTQPRDCCTPRPLHSACMPTKSK